MPRRGKFIWNVHGRTFCLSRWIGFKRVGGVLPVRQFGLKRENRFAERFGEWMKKCALFWGAGLFLSVFLLFSGGEKETKVSVIVPVYNTEKYLRTCLDSLKKQTLEDIEFIIINDGSTDKSYEIMREYAAGDRRFKTYTQENGGVG